MKIRTRVKIAGGLVIALLLAYGAVVLRLDRNMNDLVRQAHETNDFAKKISMLRNLTQDYLLHRTERAQKQWTAVYAEVLAAIEQPAPGVIESGDLKEVSQKLRVVGEIFADLMRSDRPAALNKTAAEENDEVKNRLTTQLLLITQDLLTRYFNLADRVNEKLIVTQRLTSFLDIMALSLLALLLLSNAVFLRRAVIRPVLRLHASAETIGAGNLNHRVALDSGDEIGDLARALNRMTASLQKVTVSRDELVREMIERQRAEAALHESEKRYRLLHESLRDAFVQVTMDGRIVECNDIFCQMLGYTKEEISRLTYRQLTPARWHAFEADLVRDQIIPRGYSQVYEKEYQRRDGTIFPVELRTILSCDAAGQPVAMWAIVRDITDRRRAEAVLQERSAELVQAVADLESVNAEMERFTYTISHDLKSPLVTISTFLKYLEEDLQTGDAARINKDLHFMKTAAAKMGQLLHELLEMSRIGRMVNPPVEVGFQVLAREVLQTLAGAIAERGVTVQVNPENILLFGDRPGLVQVWQNLVENGIKYLGDQPEPRLTIGLEQQGHDTVFFVCDNGMGIEPQYQDKIFGLFEKLEAGTAGSGIGLAIVKRIVELYQGRIWVESAGAGQGTCFYFTLPAAVQKATSD